VASAKNAPSQKRSLEFTGTTLQCSPDSRECSLTVDRQVIEESTSRGGLALGRAKLGPANALPLLALWLRIPPGQKVIFWDSPQARINAKGEACLTPRDDQVVGIVAEGFGNREIAQRLGTKESTVKKHRTSKTACRAACNVSKHSVVPRNATILAFRDAGGSDAFLSPLRPKELFGQGQRVG